MEVFLRVGGSDRDDSEVPLPDGAFVCLEKVLSETLPEFCAELKRFSSIEASLVYVDPARMRQLNVEYRDQDRSTDVLSFPLWEEEGCFVPPPFEGLEEIVLGDIVVCPEVVERQATGEGRSVLSENLLVVIHGFLHLIGFDHADEREKADMWAVQNRLVDRAQKLLSHEPGCEGDPS